MNYGKMKSENWSISSKDHMNYDDEESEVGNNSNNQMNEEPDEDDEDQLTVKPASTTFNAARQAMIERKLHAADERAQLFK